MSVFTLDLFLSCLALLRRRKETNAVIKLLFRGKVKRFALVGRIAHGFIIWKFSGAGAKNMGILSEKHGALRHPMCPLSIVQIDKRLNVL